VGGGSMMDIPFFLLAALARFRLGVPRNNPTLSMLDDCITTHEIIEKRAEVDDIVVSRV
jgi:hypothetical protein